MTNENWSFRPRPVNHLIIQKLDDELLIYDTNKNKAHCLNSGLRAVWEQCDGKSSLSDILQNLQKKNGKRLTINYVRLAIKQLLNEQLLEADTSNSILKDVSRRDVMRKIGTGVL